MGVLWNDDPLWGLKHSTPTSRRNTNVRGASGSEATERQPSENKTPGKYGNDGIYTQAISWHACVCDSQKLVPRTRTNHFPL